MRSIIDTITALAIAAVSAQFNIVSATSPLTGTVYIAGQSATISRQVKYNEIRKIHVTIFVLKTNTKVDTISYIVLAKGSPSALEPLSTTTENVDAQVGRYVWNIPVDTTAGEDYA
jgi:hypothetical protein